MTASCPLGRRSSTGSSFNPCGAVCCAAHISADIWSGKRPHVRDFPCEIRVHITPSHHTSALVDETEVDAHLLPELLHASFTSAGTDVVVVVSRHQRAAGSRIVGVPIDQLDRKSTRLNSSHQ